MKKLVLAIRHCVAGACAPLMQTHVEKLGALHFTLTTGRFVIRQQAALPQNPTYESSPRLRLATCSVSLRPITLLLTRLTSWLHEHLVGSAKVAVLPRHGTAHVDGAVTIQVAFIA